MVQMKKVLVLLLVPLFLGAGCSSFKKATGELKYPPAKAEAKTPSPEQPKQETVGSQDTEPRPATPTPDYAAQQKASERESERARVSARVTELTNQEVALCNTSIIFQQQKEAELASEKQALQPRIDAGDGEAVSQYQADESRIQGEIQAQWAEYYRFQEIVNGQLREMWAEFHAKYPEG